jgi:hypothetical protein
MRSFKRQEQIMEKVDKLKNVDFHHMQWHFKLAEGSSVAEWLRSLASNNLPLTAVGSNPDRDFGFFRVRKLSS